MRKLFIGMIFVFLDFTINLNATRIGLIPDFVGYIFMLQGLSELAGQSDRFTNIRPFVLGMAVYTGALYLFDLLGVTASAGVGSWLLGLVSTGISLYISYYIVLGVMDIEQLQMRDLNGANLLRAWKAYAIVSAAVFLLYLIPVLNLLSIIAGFAMGIYFLVAFYKSKELYGAE